MAAQHGAPASPQRRAGRTWGPDRAPAPPFQDVLLFGGNGNRPAHRILFAYASLLNLKNPAAAAPWCTALACLNLPDDHGARFRAGVGGHDWLPA
ncbi:hypothetical protein ACN6AT_00175 [Streptomyces sp. JL4002]|uniref:hypothetical protein n=1 Tax=Streptomyces TaxID=1883 RepID=UPI003B28BAE1